jgi:uncharacterized membrane protein
MILLLLACAGSSTDDSAPDSCADAPYVSWESFGDGFMREHCQPCHASSATERYGAPAEVTFDTYEQVLTFKDAILRVTTGDAPSMPPALSVSERDQAMLEAWLTCGLDE